MQHLRGADHGACGDNMYRTKHCRLCRLINLIQVSLREACAVTTPVFALCSPWHLPVPLLSVHCQVVHVSMFSTRIRSLYWVLVELAFSGTSGTWPLSASWYTRQAVLSFFLLFISLCSPLIVSFGILTPFSSVMSIVFLFLLCTSVYHHIVLKATSGSLCPCHCEQKPTRTLRLPHSEPCNACVMLCSDVPYFLNAVSEHAIFCIPDLLTETLPETSAFVVMAQ